VGFVDDGVKRFAFAVDGKGGFSPATMAPAIDVKPVVAFIGMDERFLAQAVSIVFCGFKSMRLTRCQFRFWPDHRFGFLALAAIYSA